MKTPGVLIRSILLIRCYMRGSRRERIIKTARRLRSMPALNRNVAVLSGTVFLFAGAWFSWYPILPLHLRHLGATDAQVGLAYTLMQLGYQGMQILGGLLADRFGRKRVIVWPTFVYLPFTSWRPRRTTGAHW